jgi:hypothetical protein
MYGNRTRRLSRKSTPYAQNISQLTSAANLNALARSGQLSWMTSPLGLQVQQALAVPVQTASSRRRPSRVGGFNIQIPSNLAGLVPGAIAPSGGGVASLLNAQGQFTPSGPEAVKDDALWKGVAKFTAWLKLADNPMIKDGKVEASKVFDTSITATPKQAAQKDKIQPFTNKLQTDTWAEVLSPEFGRISVEEPVAAVYPSPMHYVESMKIASLSSMPMGLTSQTAYSPCDDARATLASLALQPHASIIKSVANSCSLTDGPGKDWLKPETARGRFWFYLWLGLWNKFAQNSKYANALYSTGSKLLIYYDNDDIYGQGSDGSGTNAAGFLLMLARGLIAAGYASVRGNAVNPGYLFDKWVLPAIKAVYKEDGDFVV